MTNPSSSPTFITHVESAGRRYYRIGDRPPSHDRLPAGIYDLVAAGEPTQYYFRPKVLTDEGTVRCHPFTEAVLAEIASFQAARPTYAKFKFPHKRGYLLHGPPGCGKSTTLRVLAQDFVDRYDGVVFWGTAGVSPWLEVLRREYPTRPVMAIVEDVEEDISGFERKMLEFLDGAEALNDFIFVATTNRLDVIPERIKNRPSRIDRVIEVTYPDATARGIYLERFPLDVATRATIVAATSGLSMAHLKEVVISTQCLGVPLRDAVAAIRGTPAAPPDDDGGDTEDADDVDVEDPMTAGTRPKSTMSMFGIGYR